MFSIFGIFVIIVTLSCVSSRLLANINYAILSDLKDNYAELGITEKEFLELFVGEILKLDNHDHAEQTTEEVDVWDVCSTSFNESLCKEIIKRNCIDVKSLLRIAVNDQDGSVNISDAIPLLLYHIYNPACSSQDQDKHIENKHTGKLSSLKVWLYGSGFVVAIWAISMVGGFMAPFMKRPFFQRMLLFCVALGVGTVGSTGFLILLPESMELTGSDSPVPDYHYKMATVMGGVYFFYLSERLMKMWFGRERKQGNGDMNVQGKTAISSGESTPLAEGTKKKNSGHGHSHFPAELETLVTEEGDETPNAKGKKHVSTVAWMVLTGDALHKFADGMSVGAAFTQNIYVGISVSLAMCCEELPHELGDIAILIHSGLSMKKALLYNFLVALPSALGLVLGILLGENTSANIWIFAVAGGMFIYLSLVDMIPEMAEQAKHVLDTKIETAGTTLFIQNLGLLTGFTIIFVLAIYGGNMEV